MKKENLTPAIVLTVICIVVALLLAGVNMLTKGAIEEKRLAQINESLKSVAPTADTVFDDVSDSYKDKKTDSVTAVYLDATSGAYAVTVQKDGYASTIAMTVGVSATGTVTKVVVTEQMESHGKPDVAKLPDRFVGASGTSIDDVELVSGATVTSTAMRDGVKDVLVTLGFATLDDSLLKTDEELTNLAMGLIEGAEGFEDITPEESDTYVKRVFRESSGKGYAVYIYAYYYGQVVCDAIVTFDNNQTVTDIERYSWVVGHAWGGAVPPTDEEVDAFFNSFIGKNIDEIGSVELISGTTGTTVEVRAAVLSAASSVPSGEFPVARVVGILIVSVAVAAIAAVVFIKRRRRPGK